MTGTLATYEQQLAELDRVEVALASKYRAADVASDAEDELTEQRIMREVYNLEARRRYILDILYG